MALRAFLGNPSLGGFGGETSSCDAFATIVKELVDNAVDACAPFDNAIVNRNGSVPEERTTKRVRVSITAANVPVRSNNKENDSIVSTKGGSRAMECMRIEVSDNGHGMENIDYCVSVFSSSKNSGTKKSSLEECQNKGKKNNDKNMKSKGGNKSKSSESHLLLPTAENYTSGRYGVGLTLCLIHAQRLVPGTGACITSATATADEWVRATYEPDTDADNIICKKKERLPKMLGESGTTISLLVPVSIYLSSMSFLSTPSLRLMLCVQY